MPDVLIAAAVRTPIGSFGGSLKDLPAPVLGAVVVREALQRAGVAPDQVDEVMLGNVLAAGQGQNPARQAAIKAGLPVEVPALTLNQVCGSGLKSVIMGAQAILAGDADVIVAGGMEAMSSAPYLLPDARWGTRMGNARVVDSMIHDGLWDAFHDCHMGITAENLAKQYGITREEQDAFAAASQQKAAAAQQAGRFETEIVPVPLPQRSTRGSTATMPPISFSRDEYVKPETTLESLSRLKPAFDKAGTVTAGNASGINDGAAALVLVSERKAGELGLKPLARLAAWASVGVAPEIMGIGPHPAGKRMLRRAGWQVPDVDLFELNEAFAAQSLAVLKELDPDPARVNVNGGAIALGHPIGASGARILVTLLHEMGRRGAVRGLAALCVGGGMGTGVLVHRS